MVDLYLQCPEKERHIMNATCITIKKKYYLKSLQEWNIEITFKLYSS